MAVDPGLAVDPLGRTTPDDPGVALMVPVPMTTTGVADVGLGIEGPVTTF